MNVPLPFSIKPAASADAYEAVNSRLRTLAFRKQSPGKLLSEKKQRC
jgi:hypothetical protein